MRFPTVAVCTVTVLLAGGMTAQANDSLNSQGSVPEPVIPEGGSITPTIVSSKGIKAMAMPAAGIAPPESLPEQPLLPQSSAINSQLQASALSKKPQVVAEVSKALPETSNKAEALRSNQLVSQSAPATAASQLVADAASANRAPCDSPKVENPNALGATPYQLAQATTTSSRCPRPQPITPLVVPEAMPEFESSPALSIYIPVAYGADRNTVFLSGSYQNSVRRDEGSVGAAGIGIGLGDARKAVGVELSYALETTDDSFGEGGFNAKVHRQLGQDLAGAVGWNGFLNLGRNDFEQSKYGVLTKVFRTQESLNSPFSRVAVTVGVGDGQFRSNGAVQAGDNNINAFGNVAIRVVRPVSFIAEWTGQDLALGLSIAPFRNFPFVITPAVRDIAGGGDGARFVLGAGTAIRF